MILVDDFLNNPMETRAYALTLPFTTRGNYPGVRTLSHANPEWIPVFEKHLPNDEKITWFDTHPLSYNGAFQLCTDTDGDSWVHRDTTDWAAVLFLTPDAPVDSGLTLYRQAAEDTEEYQPVDVAGNVFNRLVLFRGSSLHKASAYFGKSPESSRLFQVFFFNTVSPPLVTFPPRPRVIQIIFSTNRYDYLQRMLESKKRYVSTEGCDVYTVLFDDYPSRRIPSKNAELQRAFGIDDIVLHDTNLGLPATWQEAWEYVTARASSFDYVFHMEDDFVFERPVRVMDMLKAYDSNTCSQVFLKRHVCYEPPDTDFVHRIHTGTLGTPAHGVVLQNRYFVAMCSVYPVAIAARYDPAIGGPPQEDTVNIFYLRQGLTSAMYGDRTDPPIIRHIGEVSRGLKGKGFEFLPENSDYDYRTGRRLPGPVVVCIPTTPERRDRLATTVASLAEYAGCRHVVMTYENTGEGYVKALHTLLGTLRLDTLVWCIADDVQLCEPNTLGRLVDALYATYPKGDGVVNPDDGIQHGVIMTMPLCTVETLLHHYDTRFFHYFADTLFTDIMRKKNKYLYVPEVHVTHKHHVNGLAPKDHTYASTQTHYAKDAALYELFKDVATSVTE